MKRLTVFDWLAILVVLGALVFLSQFIFKQERWVKAEIQMAPEQWWWGGNPPPYWLADSVRIGDKSYDFLGRPVAEAVEVRTLEWGGTRKEVHITVNLRAGYDSRKHKFTFNQRPLEIGRPIELDLGGTRILGLITYVEGLPDERKKVTKVVVAKILGEQPWVAEAIPVGGEMKDSRGQVLARVFDKRIELARELTVRSTQGLPVSPRGREEIPLSLVTVNPLRRDVTLTLELETTEQGGLFYFREGQLIKVGELLWIQLPGVEIKSASITDILE